MKSEYSNVRRKTFIDIGRNVFLPHDVKISAPHFVVGDNTRINGPLMVRGQEDCVIGKYCSLGYNITIITTNHDISKPCLQINMHRLYGFCSLEISKGLVRIGNNVWVGDNVTILSGVSIGDGCVVGAGSIVTKDLPACSIAAGVPAKVLKYRFSKDVIKKFLEIKWWDWAEEKIARNEAFFNTDLTKCTAEDIDRIIVD